MLLICAKKRKIKKENCENHQCIKDSVEKGFFLENEVQGKQYL